MIFLVLGTCHSWSAAQGYKSSTPEVVVHSNIVLDAYTVTSIISNADANSKDQVLIILGFDLRDTTDKLMILDYTTRLNKTYKKCYITPSPELWNRVNAAGIKMLDDLFDDETTVDMLLPDNACGELEFKDISDDLVIAIMDSNWYLQNWNKDRYINKGCYIKDRHRFWMHFNDELSGEKDKTVLLLTYHSPINYDKSGGYVPLIKNILPLPLLSNYIQKAKSYTKGIKYATHPTYREYAGGINAALNTEINIISIAASGKYQMYYKKRDNHYINVDSGDADGEFIQKRLVDWSSATKATLKLTKRIDGMSANWRNTDGSETLHEIFIPYDMKVADMTNASSYELQDTVTSPILDNSQFKNLNGFFFGNLNTKLYRKEVRVPTFNLRNEEGFKYQPKKIGGGMQTISIRLEDQNEQEFVLRSLKKVPDKLIPPPFDIDAIKYLVSYFFTGANPYAFLVSAHLEKKLNLNSLNSKLYYLPKQSSLEPYNDEIGDQLVLFKQRADGDNSDNKYFSYSEDVISTTDLIDDYWENKATIDAKQFLKCRLLDIYINDWDRHEDQWRWALIENDSTATELYQAIPRDRDQALSRYDGMFLSLVSYYSPYSFPATSFSKKIRKKDVRRNHYVASFLDNLVLSQLDKEQWQSIAKEFAEQLTDEDVNESFASIPTELRKDYQRDAEVLLNRKKDLLTTSDFLFRLVNEHLLILCSEEKDSVSVVTTSGHTRIEVYSENKDGQVIKYERTIREGNVKDIWIYALEGDDIIEVAGEKIPMQIRYVPGYGDDVYRIDEKSKSRVKIYEVLDRENGNSSNSNVTVTDRNALKSINREDFRQNYGWILPGVSYNSDDRVLLGAQIRRNTFGFKSQTRHNFNVSYATARGTSTFEYSMLKQNELRPNDIFVNLGYYGPRYEANYFGLGNDRRINVDIDESFYFLRKKLAYALGGLSRTYMNGGMISAGVGAQRIKLDLIGNRFVDLDDQVDISSFDNHYFAHAQLAYRFTNYDNLLIPHNGISFEVISNGGKSLSDNSKDYIKVESSITFMSRLIPSERVVVGSKFGGGHLIGDDPYIYNLLSIGGNESLRGYRRDRYRGNSYFFNKNNAHFYLLKKTEDNGRLHSMGVSAYFDHGRVWQKEVQSNLWHYSYGVGVFFNPLDVVVLSFAYNISPEEARVSFRLGWQL